jgi:hypothetical protein
VAQLLAAGAHVGGSPEKVPVCEAQRHGHLAVVVDLLQAGAVMPEPNEEDDEDEDEDDDDDEQHMGDGVEVEDGELMDEEGSASPAEEGEYEEDEEGDGI